ncbi:MAG: hypothetical protein Q9159_001248 [Coniocarpon cinnabarinum]
MAATQLRAVLAETKKIRNHETDTESTKCSSPSLHRDSLRTDPLRPGCRGNCVKHVENLANARGTIFYLAYGSNLAAATFRGRRNIHPISSVNVLVPELRLAFDLPGVPYSEPCFANSASRRPEMVKENALIRPGNGKPPYHKDRWQKGLVGVAYELTPSDYAHVIATEGGGAAYQDVVVDCYVLPRGADEVPNEPGKELLQVHTLFAPPRDSSDDKGRLMRPDPSYAQPSARYLKLLTDGAAENDLPREYREYLAQIRPYRATTQRQRVGRFIFLSIWQPVLTTLFSLFSTFNDDSGRAPPWLVQLASLIFFAVWASYDSFFKSAFGDGERTESDEPNSHDTKSGSDKGYHDVAAEEKVVLEMV